MITHNPEAHHADILAINEKLVIASVRQQELAETALRAEQRLRHLVHGLDAVICEVETHTGRPAFLSLRAETFLGHTLEHAQFAKEGQDYEYEFRALSADTDFIWMRNIVRLVRNGEGNVGLLRCVIVDVSAQRRAAEALEAAYARERNIAQTLQRSLLFMPPEDSFPGLAVRTLYEAASDDASVGGDFWDTFACDHGNVALVLGDVMGHGLPAAMFTAEIKFALRGFVREHEHPARILSQMNAYLCEGHRLHREGLNQEGDDSPVCLTVIIVNTATGQAAAAGAGMEPPLLVRNDGRMEEVTVSGLLLGIQLEAQYDEMSFQLEQGDWVILTTDGVTEARQGQNFLGYAGLMRLAQQGRSPGSLQQMGQAIVEGARAFAGGEFKDDACVLLARRS